MLDDLRSRKSFQSLVGNVVVLTLLPMGLMGVELFRWGRAGRRRGRRFLRFK